METKSEKKIISSQKMDKFLNKLKEMPEIEGKNNSSSLQKKEKFLQKILEDIGPID